VDAEKRKATSSRELKRREQLMFLDGLRIDANIEKAVQEITDNVNLTVNVTRLFTIEMTGGR